MAEVLRPDAVFWDEPHFYLPFGDARAQGLWACCCARCRERFAAAFGEPMPDRETAEVKRAKRSAIVDLVADMTARAGERGLRNVVCLLTDPDSLDDLESQWEPYAGMPHVDVLAADPYPLLARSRRRHHRGLLPGAPASRKPLRQGHPDVGAGISRSAARRAPAGAGDATDGGRAAFAISPCGATWRRPTCRRTPARSLRRCGGYSRRRWPNSTPRETRNTMPTQSEPPSSGGAYRAWFQCIAGCAGRYSLSDVIYRCPRCGNLLEVRHDLEPLRQRAPQDWKDLFDRRYLRTQWPYGSGVWGKRELVCPGCGGRKRRVDVRGRHQPVLGGAAGKPHWRARPVDQAVRQQPHGVVQGPGHDRAGVDGQGR